MEKQFDFVRRKTCCDAIFDYTRCVISKNGYNYDHVQLCVRDGYYAHLFRILSKDHPDLEKLKGPILLIHGLTQSMAEFTMEKEQLAYFLADNGWDVWVGNCRGTTYSRGHRVIPNQNEEEYWNFSYHEIGTCDVADFIYHILEQTKKSKVYYIGVSQGCTVLSALLSTIPEYNNKIEVACFLCPAIKFENARTSLMILFFYYIVPFLNWMNYFLRGALRGDILTYLLRVYGYYFSQNRIVLSLNQLIWNNFAAPRAGFKSNWFDLKRIFLTSPNTVSLKQLIHFSQNIRAKRFCHYDYGTEANLKMYGSRIPPLYDLGKITAPIGLFYSKNDSCFGLKDMDDLSNELGNCVHKYVVEDDNFNHFDFVYHKDIRNLLHKPLLNFLQKYITQDESETESSEYRSEEET